MARKFNFHRILTSFGNLTSGLQIIAVGAVSILGFFGFKFANEAKPETEPFPVHEASAGDSPAPPPISYRAAKAEHPGTDTPLTAIATPTPMASPSAIPNSTLLGDPAPEINTQTDFPITFEQASVSLRRSEYQFQLPDRVRLDFSFSIKVTNRSNRVLKLNLLNPSQFAKGRINGGPSFQARENKEFSGLSVCIHDNPGGCNSGDQWSVVSPGEAAIVQGTLQASVDPLEVRDLAGKTASIAGAIGVDPGGIRERFLKPFSAGEVQITSGLH